MGRDRKYKAWDSRTNYWHGVKNILIDMEGVTYYYSDSFEFSEFEEPDKLIIVEYTGLKDKNGKEIYEGDVIKVSSVCNEKLYWLFEIATANEQFGNTLFAMLLAENSTTDEEGHHTYEVRYHNKDARQYVPSGKDCEVIGNIYENPELLEAMNEQHTNTSP